AQRPLSPSPCSPSPCSPSPCSPSPCSPSPCSPSPCSPSLRLTPPRSRPGPRLRRPPVDGHGRHRLGQPFEPQAPGWPEPEPAPGPDQCGDELTGEDLRALGLVAQAAGGDDRLAMKVVAVSQRFAGLHADPDRQLRAGRRGVVVVDPSLHADGAAECL